MLKVWGLVCLFLGCMVCGLASSENLKRRLELLEAFRRIMILLSGEIRCVHSTLPEALERIKEKAVPPFDCFLARICEDMKGENRKPLGELFERHLGILKESSLNEEDLLLIHELGKQLGYLDIAMQLQTLEYYEEMLDTSVKKAAGEYGKKARMYRYLGVLAGLFLVVLLS